MLGNEQKQEFFEWLWKHKNSPWKFVITPVSLTTKQSWLADGWHGGKRGENTGILSERQEIFDFIYRHNMTHSTIFLSGDTHNAHVSKFHEIEKQASTTKTTETNEKEQEINNNENVQQTEKIQCQSENCNSEEISDLILVDSSSSDLPIISVHTEPQLVNSEKKIATQSTSKFDFQIP